MITLGKISYIAAAAGEDLLLPDRLGNTELGMAKSGTLSAGCLVSDTTGDKVSVIWK